MKIMPIGDVHHPFMDWKKFMLVVAIAKAEQPDAIIQIGDLYDMYSFSKFPRNPDFIKPEDECKEGREDAEKMWKMLKEACPKAKLYQMHGNHDLRPVRYVGALSSMVLSAMKKWLKEQMTFKGVELVPSEHEIDGVMFTHGDNFRRLGDQCRYNQQNSVCGHSHRPGVYYDQNKDGPYWELNVGWLGDSNSEAFSYRAQKKIHKMITGVGIIEDGQPRFIVL